MVFSDEDITDAQNKAIYNLKLNGCAVTIFTPKELGTTCRMDVESGMKKGGRKIVDENCAKKTKSKIRTDIENAPFELILGNG